MAGFWQGYHGSGLSFYLSEHNKQSETKHPVKLLSLSIYLAE